MTKKKLPAGDYVGVPAAWALDEFAFQALLAFPEALGIYQVGTSVVSKTWRDVDLRLILSDEDWAAYGFEGPTAYNPKWRALCWAFSCLGRSITGLPIDFQIQQMSHANEAHKGPRMARGIRQLVERQ